MIQAAQLFPKCTFEPESEKYLKGNPLTVTSTHVHINASKHPLLEPTCIQRRLNSNLIGHPSISGIVCPREEELCLQLSL